MPQNIRASWASLVFVLSFSVGAHSFESPPSPPALRLDFPIVELPFDATDGGYRAPSMRQSLHLSTNFIQGVHFAIAATAAPQPMRRLGIVAFDLLTATFPLSSTWMHEEWHRAVMSHRGISSFNDTYDFPIGRNVIAVSHVGDDDLARLKRDFPADHVRLSTAGIESQYEQNLLLESRRFFDQTPTWDKLTLWFNHVNNIFYLHSCAEGPDADKTTDELNGEDGANLARRDFTGLDCTAWVYDLFRPDEPYASRGTHPSGVGLNRYRRFSDLAEEEKHFLRQQRALSLVNLIDPFLFNFDSFEGGPGDRWNFTLRHHLTSFGYSLESNVFIKDGERNWLVKLHGFLNVVRYFPGLTVELSRYPFRGAFLSARASAWMQPEAQRVKSTVSVPGGLLSGTVARPIFERAEVFAGLDAKTAGWVAGNVYLESNLSVFSGMSLLF